MGKFGCMDGCSYYLIAHTDRIQFGIAHILITQIKSQAKVSKYVIKHQAILETSSIKLTSNNKIRKT